MSVYELLIFTREGKCIYHTDLTNKLDFNDEKAIVDRQKLIFGLVWSLKAFSRKMSTTKIHSFKSYKTAKYKLHIFEIATGLKFILLTVPVRGDLTANIKEIYDNIYVPFVAKNIFQDLDAKIDNQKFNEEIQKFIKEI